MYVHIHAATDDYSSTVANITILNGTQTSNISIQIIDDTFGEGTETFTVELSNPSSGLTLTTPNTTTVVIPPDVMIAFNPTGYTVNEGDTINLTVELTGDTPSDNVTVDFNIQNGTALGKLTCNHYFQSVSFLMF